MWEKERRTGGEKRRGRRKKDLRPKKALDGVEDPGPSQPLGDRGFFLTSKRNLTIYDARTPLSHDS
jgi:hypothetical protein